MDRRYLPPTSLCLLVLGLWRAQAIGLLPPTAILADRIVDLLREAGPWAVGLVAAIENTVGVNSYFPGAIPLLMLAATAVDLPEVARIVFLILLGQLSGLTLSFAFGVALARRECPRRPLGRRAMLAVPLFAHPQSAAATAFLWGGTFHRRALLVIAAYCMAWSVFWGTFIHLGGSFLIREVGWDYVTFSVCLGWLAWLAVGDVVTGQRRAPRSAGAVPRVAAFATRSVPKPPVDIAGREGRPGRPTRIR